MTEPENPLLFADEFTAADQSFLAGLHCGDEPWSRAATEWITGSEVIDSIEQNQTKVWIYRNSEADDAIVGFSSLSATGWLKWPPPDGKRSRLTFSRCACIVKTLPLRRLISGTASDCCPALRTTRTL